MPTGTENTRRRQIELALTERRSRPSNTAEGTRVPFRGQSTLLEVIDVPLNVPVLNAHSFRIAPMLADHPEREVVRRDPESPRSQEIVAGLVRSSHREAEKLKQSLSTDGQDTPGLITRDGKLINANTRCVLMRELENAGQAQSSVMRVAVLPSDATNAEELALESVLQQQEELKDKYTLVSKLMMIDTLRREAKMSDQQIGASLRETPSRITDLRAVLVLMERARRLTSSNLPLTVFVTHKDQTQNWLELLRTVRETEREKGRMAADDHIRGWLVAYYSNFDSVHQLRNARDNWIHRDVLPVLEATDGLPAAVARTVTTAVADRTDVQGVNDRRARAADLGLDDLLDEGESAHDLGHDVAVQRLLDLVAEAKTASEVSLQDGEIAPAPDVMEAVKGAVDSGIRAVKRRTAGANKLARPKTQVENAISATRAATDAVTEVAEEPAFLGLVPSLTDAVLELELRLQELTELISSIDPDFDAYETGVATDATEQTP